MRELRVEVRHVRVGFNEGHKGSLQLLLQQGVPVHALEPRVALYLERPVLGAQPVLWLLLEEALKQVP